ncbi:ATP-binding cassette domain-containing protein [Methanothermobacter sp. THM-2]|uniref:ATP-binding cassette domain-containing protein n=1 Tax=Methanothermobacter sp. THM-2 TaxID=2606912 RepID=UPI001366284A|nr:ATP-binding cassette domain-containing protein [Methanothermobacter sp. THM-2]QHN08343.1 ATP-binding cassette domain-containing protein [Methanothermobacter sp. THM-2]
MIQVQNLSYTYPDGTQALKNINLEILDGERVAVIGPNGAGKSTLFLHFNGILEPSSGEILIDGNKIRYSKDELMKVRQKVGIVFQNPDDQLFSATVGEDVAFGPVNLGLDDNEVEKRVRESLEKVGMLGYEGRSPHHLSGGEKKRVAIAGILAMRPEIMVLDEPTTGLDPQTADGIIDILLDLSRDGITIIISSHDVEVISQFAERIFVLNHGELIADGTPEEIFSDPEIIKKASLRLPRTADLMNRLRQAGFDVDVKLTVEEAYHELLHILGADAYHKLLHFLGENRQHRLIHLLGEDKYHELLHILREEKTGR